MEENELMSAFLDHAKKTDTVNKRMFILCAILSLSLVIGVIAFCIRDTIRDTKIVHDYFNTDYDYSSVVQNMGDVSDGNQNITNTNGVENYGQNSETN